MSLSENAKQLAANMARQHDEILQAQLEAHGVKFPDDVPSLKERLVRTVYADKAVKWELDSVHIITFFPVELIHEDSKLNAVQRYALPTGTEPSAIVSDANEVPQ